MPERSEATCWNPCSFPGGVSWLFASKENAMSSEGAHQPPSSASRMVRQRRALGSQSVEARIWPAISISLNTT